MVINSKQTNAGVTYLRETRAKPEADIFWASAPDAFQTLDADGLLEKYSPPKAVLLGIRPEAVQVSERRTSGDGLNQIEGTILASAYQGGGIEYEIAAMGNPIKARIANPKGKPFFQRGDKIIVAFAAEDVTFIPAKSAE